MKNPLIIILSLLLSVLTTCKAQHDDTGKYNRKYVIGNIPGYSDFLILGEHDSMSQTMNLESKRELDSLSLSDTAMRNSILHEMGVLIDFINNRSRIFFEFANKVNENNDKPLHPEPSIPCDCITDNDTLLISMKIGFWGGIGFDIIVSQGIFESEFIEWEEKESFKSDPNDTAYTQFAYVKSKYQYLVLDQEPVYKPGQQISGYLTYTSNSYYKKPFSYTHGDLPDVKMDLKAKIYFTCTARQKRGSFMLRY